MRIDLHAHSNVSDGTQAPGAVMAAAAEAGLDVVALTDHDSTDGWAAATAVDDLEPLVAELMDAARRAALARRIHNDVAATTRASFAVHTTRADIDALVDAIHEVRRIFE